MRLKVVEWLVMVCGFVVLIAWCAGLMSAGAWLGQQVPVHGAAERILTAAGAFAGLALALWSAAKVLRA